MSGTGGVRGLLRYMVAPPLRVGGAGTGGAGTREPGTSAAPARSTADGPGSALVPLYRMWHQGNGDHFYTASRRRADEALANGWTDQGPVCRISTTPTDRPLYLTFNPEIDDHFYVASWSEVLAAGRDGWRYRGITGYLGGTVPLHQLWNSVICDHLYLTGWPEVCEATEEGWHYQGIVGYAW